MMMKRFFAPFAALALASCATSGPGPGAGQVAPIAMGIYCSAGADCQERWSRATAWVAQNSAYKVQTSTDSLIQTMGPLPYDPSPAYTVTKTAVGEGRYEIVINGGCDNILGCIPSIAEARTAFSTFVSATPAAAEKKAIKQKMPVHG